jgi:DNA-binding transcriptional ArsR family regulator
MTSDLLGRVRGEIDQRLEQLRPLVVEYERLLAGGDALAATGADSHGSSDVPVTRRSSRAPARQRDRPLAAGDETPEGRTDAPSAPSFSRPPATRRPRPERPPRGVAGQAIVAALEHGSHTVSELAVVTAMSAPSIRAELRRLLKAGAVRPAKRDGKAAYALPGSPGAD